MKMKKIENAKKSRRIIGYVVIAVLIALAILAIVGNVVNYKFNFSNMVDMFFVLVICLILCIIAYFSIVKNTFDAAAKAQNEQTFSFDKKNFLIGLFIFLACAAASSPLFILGIKEINKTNSPNYVKAEAVVTWVNYGDETVLRYVYFDENGNEIISSTDASFGGTTFKENQTVTVYYNKYSPQIIVNLGTAAFELCGAIFFVMGGLIAFLANMELHKFIPIIFCFTFMIFSGGMLTGTMLSSGMNLWEIYTGGVLGFACCIFFLIGFSLLIPSVIDFVKFVISAIKNRRENKKLNSAIEELENKINRKKSITAIRPTAEETFINEDKNLEKKKAKAKKRKSKVKYKHRFCKQALIFIIVGLVFGGAGGFMLYGETRDLIIASNYIKCEATITDLRIFEGKNGLLGSPIYTYVVDGVEYTQEASYSQSASILPEIGTKVTIRYNKNDPTDIKDGEWISLIGLFVSFIPLGVGIGMFVFSWRMMRVEASNIDKNNENKTILDQSTEQ